jgi:hypothetical protein
MEHVLNTVLVNPKSYVDFDKLLKLIDKIKTEVSLYDWNSAMDALPLVSKDVSSTYQSWDLTEYHKLFGTCADESSMNKKVTYPQGLLKFLVKPSKWLILYLYESCKVLQNNEHIDPYFSNSKKMLKELNLSGCMHLSLHFLEPGFKIRKHIDNIDEGEIISLLYTINLSSNNPEQFKVHIENNSFELHKNRFFAFDPQIPHYAVNNSDDTWIAVMLRIDKTKFLL